MIIAASCGGVLGGLLVVFSVLKRPPLTFKVRSSHLALLALRVG
jgi:hypothetical protein